MNCNAFVAMYLFTLMCLGCVFLCTGVCMHFNNIRELFTIIRANYN